MLLMVVANTRIDFQVEESFLLMGDASTFVQPDLHPWRGGGSTATLTGLKTMMCIHHRTNNH